MAPQTPPLSTKDLVDVVLFSSTAGQRELQSSPILGDVWLEYAEAPAKRVDLLITPQFGIPAGPLAKEISSRLGSQSPRKGKRPRRRSEKDQSPNVAYLQGLIAARLTFSEVIGNILPMTNWWDERLT
jgi:serine protease AprX